MNTSNLLELTDKLIASEDNTGCGDDLTVCSRSALLRLVAAVKNLQTGGDHGVIVTLNSFDDEGNIVDTTCQTITCDQTSDIVDHAAQYVLVSRVSGTMRGDSELAVLAELEDALIVANVITEQ